MSSNIPTHVQQNIVRNSRKPGSGGPRNQPRSWKNCIGLKQDLGRKLFYHQREYPHQGSHAQIAEAFCLTGDDNNITEELRKLGKDALKKVPEVLSWLWTDRAGYKILWKAFSKYFCGRVPDAMKTSIEGNWVDPGNDKHKVALLSARLGWALHQILKANLETRKSQFQGWDVYQSRYTDPVAWKGANDLGFTSDEQYWHLIFQLVLFIRGQTGAGGWLDRNVRRQDNQDMRAVLEDWTARGNQNVVAHGAEEYTQLRIRTVHHPKDPALVTLDHTNPLNSFADLTKLISRRLEFSPSYSIHEILWTPKDTELGSGFVIKNDENLQKLLQLTLDEAVIDLRVDYDIKFHPDFPEDRHARSWFPGKNYLFAGKYHSDERLRELDEDHKRRLFAKIEEMYEGAERDPTQQPSGSLPNDKIFDKIEKSRTGDWETFSNMTYLDEEVLEGMYNAADHGQERFYRDMDDVMRRIRDLVNKDGDADPEWLTKLGPYDLEPFQQASIAYFLEKERDRSGGMIADEAGVGKTAQIALCILANHHRETHVLGQQPTKPHLVMVPTTLVEEMANELPKMLGPKFSVWKHGDEYQPWTNNIYKLKVELKTDNLAFRQQGYLQTNPGTNVIIMAYEALPFVDSRLRKADLKGLVHRLLCDEGHMLRHCLATIRGQYLLALEAPSTWLFSGGPLVNTIADILGYIAILEKPRFSAGHVPYAPGRPRSNSLEERERIFKTTVPQKVLDMPLLRDTNLEDTDIAGTKYLLRYRNSHGQACPPPPFDGEPVFETCANDEKKRLKCHTMCVGNYWIKRHILNWDREVAKGEDKHADCLAAVKRLGVLMGDFILRRRHESTYIPEGQDKTPRKVSPNLKPMHTKRVELNMSITTKAYHDQYAQELSLTGPEAIGEVPLTNLEVNPAKYIAYQEDDDNEDPDSIADGTRNTPRAKYTRMCALASHPATAKFPERDSVEWRKRLLAKSLPYLLWEMRQVNACGMRDTEAPFDDDVKIIEHFMKDAPKYQACALDVNKIITKEPADKNKVIVYTQSPVTSLWLSKMFNFLGIPSLLLHAGEDPAKRYGRIQREFNSADGNAKVLIVPMTLKMQGLNLDKFCNNVIFMEQAFNYTTMMQCMYRIRRRTQTKKQFVYRYFLPDTFMAVVERRTYHKQWAIELLSASSVQGRLLNAQTDAATATELSRAREIVGHRLGVAQVRGRGARPEMFEDDDDDDDGDE